MSSKIILLKLSTSEEIITTIKEDNDDHYILDRPRITAPAQTPDGKVTLILIPWLMGAQNPGTKFESPIRLEKVAVIGMALEPPKALVDKYITETTGIEIFTG